MEPVVCEGAPRDQGLDQGFACGAAIRDRVARAGLESRRRFPTLKALASGKVSIVHVVVDPKAVRLSGGNYMG